eukprot:363248-Chlamydomonas_euryale.AAC.9
MPLPYVPARVAVTWHASRSLPWAARWLTGCRIHAAGSKTGPGCRLLTGRNTRPGCHLLAGVPGRVVGLLRIARRS